MNRPNIEDRSLFDLEDDVDVEDDDEASDALDPFEVLAEREEQAGTPIYFWRQ